MGIFSKIFGNSDDPEAAGSATQAEDKIADRDTSPPTRTPSRPEQFAKANATESSAEATPAAKGTRASPPDLPARTTEAHRGQGSAVQSPRPSIPPRVEATLLSARAEAPAKATTSKKDESKSEGKKRGAAPPPIPSKGNVSAAPIRPVGTRSVGGAPERTTPVADAARPAAAAAPNADAAKSAPNAAPAPAAAQGDAARKAPQAEPLELDPLGQSVAPPPNVAPANDDVDHAFAQMVSQAPAPKPGSLAVDEQVKKANEELFRAMAVTHAEPIKDFLLELVVGPVSKLWLDIARPAVESIRKGAAELGQEPLVVALNAFEECLSAAARSVGSKVEGPEREALIRAHAALSAALPQAFDLVKERDQREPLVVRHLLLQVPGVHKVTIDKLYAAGLASLDALCRSSVDDLVQVGRLERDRADAISSRFRQYWSERAAQPVHKADDRARKKLATLLEQLANSHRAFQRAEADEDREKKRDARNARRATALAINVLLAQLGEVDLVEELERSPTDRRIERVRSYVDVMARARPAQQQKEAS